MTPKSNPIIKICGLSTPETLAAALDAGADRIGLVFFPRSPRHVSLTLARELAAQARGRAAIVALVVDADDETLANVMQSAAPDWLQLHGAEPPERVRAIRDRFDRPVMKAVGVRTTADVASAAAYDGAADAILFDAKPPSGAALPGGNGQVFDWAMLRGARHPFMLSGGLSPGNVATALRSTGAQAVDVSSGVERTPGVKDPELIRAFVNAARQDAGLG